MAGSLSAAAEVRPDFRPRRHPLQPRYRVLLHGIALVAGWWLFLWFWVKVFIRQRNQWDTAVTLIIVAIIVVPILTAWWISHNRAIYRRRGPRGRMIPGPEIYDVDWPGRRVEADWDALRQARSIRIIIDGGVKRMEVDEFRPPPAGSVPVSEVSPSR